MDVLVHTYEYSSSQRVIQRAENATNDAPPRYASKQQYPVSKQAGKQAFSWFSFLLGHTRRLVLYVH